MSGGRLDLGTLSPNTLSPGGLAPRMDRLSVSGNRPDMNQIMGGGLPPGSPLLEAYKGTWQSLSPMPSPMMLPNDDVDDLPPLEGLSSREERKREKRNRIRDDVSPGPRSSRKEKEREKEKRAKFYDAEEDALALVDALGHRTPDTRVIANIIPALSHDQLMELRSEYKRHCKVQGRGINIAKHLKMKTTGNFGKICYVTALGRWESEGYWANYWYQSQGAKRELLIEALMGRSNYEIEEIKDSFRDKRYSDNLIKCMDKELKADKFRTAVLMALEEKRQDERDVYPEEYRNRDVHTLHNAVKSREGGESTMLQIVITRSDAHLRDILKRYERVFQSNFAKDALRKSNNLVGEVIAHILNGIINKPARDAMLLYHALTDLMDTPAPTSSGRSSSDKVSSAKHERQQRYELLMSRLVRLHWDKIHLMRVKNEYKDKYRRYLEEDIEDATRGDFQEFCLALCEVQR
ncbi:Annexin [Patellaria atrata CBS 101060]|uniref:Annexin n=1 Tax=Patellaria atrata CBS 101060 TaxID=1346257 RepID=A0A9P4SCK8_9PEZI|nr:Annexin [Patellaria atrata CBS 101060]